MKRLTTDTPQGNLETALNLFYIRDRETWVRGGCPAPEFKDVTLDNYMRDLIKAHIPTAVIPEGAADFSAMMAEWLFDDADTAEGTLATLYAAAWAFAELRHRLKSYEDTGLGPDDIKAMYSSIEKVGAPFLPCKIGDTMWGIARYNNKVTKVKKGTVTGMYYGDDMRLCIIMKGVCRGEYGKDVFDTRETAEAAFSGERSVGIKPVNDLYDEDGGEVVGGTS